MNAARDKWQILHMGSSLGLTDNFSSAHMEAKRQWTDIFKILEVKKNTQPINNSVSTKLFFKNEGEIKTLPELTKPESVCY